MPKRQLDVENKENEEPLSSAPTTEPTPAKKAKTIETEPIPKPESLINADADDEDEDDEEENEPMPIAAVIEHNPGTVHPTNKQYFVYQNTQPTMISNTARFWSRKYLKVLRNVNPDVYNMYIHNDFTGYGELEVIENCLIDIAKGIFLKRKSQMNSAHYIMTFRRLEALTIVLDCSDNFPGIDDGDRFVELIRVIGACYVTILRDLLPKSMFNNEELSNEEMRKLIRISHQLPNFKEIIKQALIQGQMYLSMGDVCSGYTSILQTVYCKWSLIIDKIRIDSNIDISKALRHAAAISKDDYQESFDFMTELRNYSANHPSLGGSSHDLRKWSKAQRNLYSFNNFNNDSDDEDNDNFWFRL